jgi:1-acylglycerone phosphate reductase
MRTGDIGEPEGPDLKTRVVKSNLIKNQNEANQLFLEGSIY